MALEAALTRFTRVRISLLCALLAMRLRSLTFIGLVGAAITICCVATRLCWSCETLLSGVATKPAAALRHASKQNRRVNMKARKKRRSAHGISRCELQVSQEGGKVTLLRPSLRYHSSPIDSFVPNKLRWLIHPVTHLRRPACAARG